MVTPQAMEASVLLQLLGFLVFFVKALALVFVIIWVRWTVPRFRYDQVMHLGWKVVLPTALGYVVLIAGTVLVLDHLQVAWGFTYGLIITLVSGFCTIAFVFFVDRDRVMAGASRKERVNVTRPPTLAHGTGD
jgi:NADH-quinone oxidoreductase subunit H